MLKKLYKVILIFLFININIQKMANNKIHNNNLKHSSYKKSIFIRFSNNKKKNMTLLCNI